MGKRVHIAWTSVSLVMAGAAAATTIGSGAAIEGMGPWTLETTVVEPEPCTGRFDVLIEEAAEGWKLAIDGVASCPSGAPWPLSLLLPGYSRSVDYWDIPLDGSPETGFTWEDGNGLAWTEIGPIQAQTEIVFVDYNDIFGVHETFTGTFRVLPT